jgi:hypothetical protein
MAWRLSTIPVGNGMVECDRFLIIKRPPSAPFASHYEILDASTQRTLGIARARPNRLASLWGRLADSRFLPMKLEAHETEDEPLVFIVRRSAGFLRGQARIADADDHRLGRLVVRGTTAKAGFWILDRQNFLFVTGEFDEERSAFVLRSGDGAESATWQVNSREVLIDFDASLHEQPLAKMLLLGSALALDMIFPT